MPINANTGTIVQSHHSGTESSRSDFPNKPSGSLRILYKKPLTAKGDTSLPPKTENKSEPENLRQHFVRRSAFRKHLPMAMQSEEACQSPRTDLRTSGKHASALSSSHSAIHNDSPPSYEEAMRDKATEGTKHLGIPDEPPPSYEEAMIDQTVEETLQFLQQHRASRSPTPASDEEDNAVTGTFVVVQTTAAKSAHTNSDNQPEFLKKDLAQLSTADHKRMFETDELPPVPDGWDIQQAPSDPDDLIYMITENVRGRPARKYTPGADYDAQGKNPSALQGKAGNAFEELARKAPKAMSKKKLAQNSGAKKRLRLQRDALPSKQMPKEGPPPPKYIPKAPLGQSTDTATQAASAPPAPNYIPAPPPHLNGKK